MKYLPFDDFEIHTALTSDEVFYRFRAAVDTKGTWQILINKPFWGKVKRNVFRISRATWWNPNFSLIISGEIQPEGSGSCIRVKIRLAWLFFLFWLFWLGGVWYIFFGGITKLIIQKIQTGIWQIESPFWMLPPIFMFAVGYLMVIGNFKHAANRSKEIFWRSFGVTRENVFFKGKIFGFTEFQIINMLLLLTVTVSVLAIAISFL
jgi:hypothetical protein